MAVPTPNRVLLLTAAGVALLVAFLASAAAAAPPPLQPIEVVRDVPDPPGLSPDSAILSHDAHHVIVQVEDGGKTQVGVMDLDGSNYDCLSCGVMAASDPDLFGDDRRLLVRIDTPIAPGFPDDLNPIGGGLGDLQFGVLECEPDLYHCRHALIRELNFPIDGLTEGAQVREVAIHPDNHWVKWNEVRSTEGERMTIGRLVRVGDHYEAVEPRVLNESYSLTAGPDGWIAGGRFYESGGGASGASFWRGGATLKYGTTTTALNYDGWQLDLATGERSQDTTDLDYNEMSDLSPDGRWLAASSARGLDRMDIFTQLERPPFIDVVAFPQAGRVGLFNNRRCMNERWLWRESYGQQLGGYSGQPVVTQDNWLIRGWRFFPNGRRALIYEERLPNEPEPADPADRNRIRIIRFPGIRPGKPLPQVSLDELDLSWAAPYDSYHTMAFRQVPGQTVAGRASGTATMTFSGTFAAGSWRVDYADYSDDGRSFVSGSESLSTPNPVAEGSYAADLTIAGEHTGYLRGTVEVLPQNRYRANIESEVDGVHFDRIPTQADCPGIHQPRLDLDILGREPIAGDRERVDVRVSSLPPESGPTPFPVRLADVQLGPRARGEQSASRQRPLVLARARTDRAGRATLIVHRRAGKHYVIGARAGGFKPAQIELEAGAG